MKTVTFTYDPCDDCHWSDLNGDNSGLYVPAEVARRLLEALKRLADASEAFASSDPDMPSHEATEDEFDAALENARRVISAAEGEGEGQVS